ncbi:MAG: helix-turn-helix transcriptional regulator [Candidatus Tectomicrobia bacterium]|nr:helix-turn-helix transcriptional regulator [Candidatus Tectomicrobia bacterium]
MARRLLANVEKTTMAQRHILTGKEIKDRRESENITRQQLAHVTGLLSSRIADIEGGRISASFKVGTRLTSAMEQLHKIHKLTNKLPTQLLEHYIDCPPYRSRHRITLCIVYKTDGIEMHQQSCTNCPWFNEALKRSSQPGFQLVTLDDIVARN